jgi:hypothetical protein
VSGHRRRGDHGQEEEDLNPQSEFVQQNPVWSYFDPDLLLYSDILGPSAFVTTAPISAGQNISFSPTLRGAAVVGELTTDGAVEANMTGYFLDYDPQPTDPAINFEKANANQTSFPVTDDCSDVVLF